MTWLALAAEPVPGWLSSVYPGFGIAGADIPADGDNGPSPVLNDGAILPDAEYRWELVSGPAAGALTLYENLTFLYDAAGVPAGIYSFVYRLYQMGVAQGTATVTITVGEPGGVLSAAAAGVSVVSGGAVLGAVVPLVASGLVVAGGAAGQVVTVSLSATSLATAAAAAGLSAGVLAQGAAAAEAAGNGDLAVQLQALANGAAEAGGSAALAGGPPGSVSAAGGAAAGGQADIKVRIDLQAAGAGEAGGAAQLTTTVTVTAAGFVQAMGAGVWRAELPLAAFGNASAWGAASASLYAPGDVPAAPAGVLIAIESVVTLAIGVEPRGRLTMGVVHAG